MKVQGGNSSGPIDINQAKANKAKDQASVEAKVSAQKDLVDTKLSQTLDNLTKAIADSGLTAGELHSHVDEDRLNRVLESIDRVDAKQPRLSDDQLLALSDRLVENMTQNPQKAASVFGSLNPSRVADLLSEPV